MTRRPWGISLLPSAREALRELREPVRHHIEDAIDEISHDPFSPDSIAMSGKASGLRRLRAGEYRIVYSVSRERNEVLIYRIGHRSEVYRGLEPRKR